MSIFCSDACGEIAFPDFYVQPPAPGAPCPEEEKPSCCIGKFGFVVCTDDAVPADITDPADIQALIADGKIIIFDNVGVVFGEPTQTNYEKPCGQNIIVRQEQLIDLTVFTNSATHADEVFWNKMCKLNGKFGIFWTYEDNYTVLNQSIVKWFLDGQVGTIPAVPLGIEGTFTKQPYRAPFNKNEPCRWLMQFKIDYSCTLMAANIAGFN